MGIFLFGLSYAMGLMSVCFAGLAEDKYERWICRLGILLFWCWPNGILAITQAEEVVRQMNAGLSIVLLFASGIVPGLIIENVVRWIRRRKKLPLSVLA